MKLEDWSLEDVSMQNTNNCYHLLYSQTQVSSDSQNSFRSWKYSYAWVCYFVNLKRNIIPVSLYLYHYSEIPK